MYKTIIAYMLRTRDGITQMCKSTLKLLMHKFYYLLFYSFCIFDFTALEMLFNFVAFCDVLPFEKVYEKVFDQ